MDILIFLGIFLIFFGIINILIKIFSSDKEEQNGDDKTMENETIEDDDSNTCKLYYYMKNKSFATLNDWCFSDAFFDAFIRLEKEGYKCMVDFNHLNEGDIILFKKVKSNNNVQIEKKIEESNSESGFLTS